MTKTDPHRYQFDAYDMVLIDDDTIRRLFSVIS